MPRLAVTTHTPVAFELQQLRGDTLPGHRNQPLLDPAVDVFDDRVRSGVAFTQRGEDLLFDRSSADLKPRLTELLATISPILGRLDNKIQIHGHTDAKPFPTGSNRSNWALSFERADSARLVLEKSGLKKGQVGGVFAHGSSALYNPKDPFAPENRRLAILAVRRGMETYAAQGVSATPKTAPTGAGTKPAPPPVAPTKHSEADEEQN